MEKCRRQSLAPIREFLTNAGILPKATKKEIVTAFRTQEILAAARQLLDQRGLEAMTMEEIAAAAGVAKGTVYLYFQSKDRSDSGPHHPGGGKYPPGPGVIPAGPRERLRKN